MGVSRRHRVQRHFQSFDGEPHSISGRQPQLRGGIDGDLGGQARCAIGLLLAAHQNRRSAGVQGRHSHFEGIARAAVWRALVHGDGRGREHRDRLLSCGALAGELASKGPVQVGAGPAAQ